MNLPTFFAFAFVGFLQGPAVQVVPTTIRDVTVYPTEALVTRVGKARVDRGVTRVEVRSLPMGLRDDSMRVRSSAGANVVGVDVLLAAAQTSPSPAVEDLRKQREAKQRDREANSDRVEVLKSQRAYLDSIRAEAPKIFGQGSLSGSVDPGKWKEAVEFLTTSFTNNVDSMRKLQERDGLLAAEIAELDQKLQELQSGKLVATKTLAIDLLANAPGEADLELSYLVGNCGWRPAYDLRAAKDLRSADLLLSAVVAQRTGEDWTDVNLTFSTAKPERGAQPPKPETLVLVSVAAQKFETIGVGGGSTRGRAPSEKKRGFADEFEAADKDAANAPASPAPALAVDAEVFASGLATQLRVPRAESVPADNRPHRVRVAEVPFKLEPIHVTVPRLATRAFVQAKPKNTAAFPVLGGVAQVFVGNDFVGKINVPETPIGEPLELALGADPGITIERRQEKADREGPGFLGSRVRYTYQYRITVKNVSAATGPATVEVVEPIPISRDDRIKVEVTSCEPPFLRGAKEDRERESQGFLRWRLPVAPGEERVIQLTYVVSAPEDLPIGGLER